jgi:2-C-methyl-D-erythritol 4-phosphate cytidylyltransferase
MLTAIVVAGGRGLRMGATQPKQFLRLGSRPILAHTLRVFEAHGGFGRIYLVVGREYWERCQREVLRPLNLSTPIQLVPGGDERQDSVYNALAAMAPTTTWVVVHDGVRPFTSPEEINRCLAQAQIHGAAIVGCPLADTVKQVSPQGLIASTLPRSQLWRAQTPQVFSYPQLWAAHQRARRDKYQVTDDAQLLEWLGQPVALVPGRSANIKITTPEDLILAEALLKSDPQGA